MRAQLLSALFLTVACFVRADIVEFDLSPPGSGVGIGLHPGNEIIPGFSNGSGNEIGSGIFLDTTTRMLTLNLAYGSAFGFGDLTGPAFSWLIHGPSPVGETAPVLFNLEPMHTFAIDPARGGQISGSFTLNAQQQDIFLTGRSYINIYTPANSGGEIRGQLVVVPEPQSWALLISGALSLVTLASIRRNRAAQR